MKKLVIFLVLILSLVPAYFFNKWMQKIIEPRRSLFRLFLYFLAGFTLVFIYSFLLVTIIVKLFPVQE